MFATLDALLRGKFTDQDRITGRSLAVPIGSLLKAALVMGATYGVCMGLFALLAWEHKGAAALQVVSSTLKVPLLFLLTLLVTFPSLYVLGALARTRLGAADTARLLLVAITVNLVLLASLGPITVFFTLSTNSYPFMILLNVLFFGLAGLAGLMFLRRALDNYLTVHVDAQQPPAEAATAGSDAPIVTPHRRRNPDDVARTRRLFGGWCMLFGVVGAQMGWVLRPFIGSPTQPFEVFRARSSNFLRGVLQTLADLVS